MKKSLIFGAALFVACAFGFQSCSQVDTPAGTTPTTDPVAWDAANLSFSEFISKYYADGVVYLPAGATFTVEEEMEFFEPITFISDDEDPASIVLKKGFVVSNDFALVNVVIDAAEATTPLVKMNALPKEGLNDAGAFEVEAITFEGVTVNGLKSQLFYANKQKYLIKNLNVVNSTINIVGASKKTIFDFNGGGLPMNVNIQNSTIAADEATEWQNGGFYSTQSGAKNTDVTTAEDFKQVFTIENSKLTNIAKSKTLCSLRQNNQAWQYYVVKDNTIANCGKSGQFLKGLVAGQNVNKKENWTASGNTITFDGVDIGADENKNSGIEGACIVPETPAAE